ncbi:MAG: hypothetical protein Ta2G_13900 [Termitinemataceae bacterium]|nr:MAG: hypothetical protein Ta2G_13900 [Termitinemataceae bacterium]
MAVNSNLPYLSKAVQLGNISNKLGWLGAGMMAGQDVDKNEIKRLIAEQAKLSEAVPTNAFTKYLGATIQSVVMQKEAGLAGLGAGLINPALGAGVAFGLSAPLYAGLAYIDMIESGIDEGTAKRMAATSGVVQGLVDVALDVVPVKGIAKGALSKSLFKNFYAKGTYKTMADAVKKRMVREGIENILEMPLQGLSEIVQDSAADLYLNLAANESDALYHGVNWEAVQALKPDLEESFKGGLAMTIILGFPVGTLRAIHGVREAKTIAEKANEYIKTSPTPEVAEAKMNSDPVLKETFSKESTHDLVKQAFKEKQKGIEAYIEKEGLRLNPTPDAPAKALRNEHNQLSLENLPTETGGTLRIKNPDAGMNDTYAKIKYKVDGDRLIIKNVDAKEYVVDRDEIVKEAIEALQEKTGTEKVVYGDERSAAEEAKKYLEIARRAEEASNNPQAMTNQAEVINETTNNLEPLNEIEINELFGEVENQTPIKEKPLSLAEMHKAEKEKIRAEKIQRARERAKEHGIDFDEKMRVVEERLKTAAEREKAESANKNIEDRILDQIDREDIDRIFRTPEIKIIEDNNIKDPSTGKKALGAFVLNENGEAEIRLSSKADAQTYIHEKIHALARTLREKDLERWDNLETGIDLKTAEGQEDFVDLMLEHLRGKEKTGVQFFDDIIEMIKEFIEELRRALKDANVLTPEVKEYLDGLLSDPDSEAAPEWNNYFKGEGGLFAGDEGGKKQATVNIVDIDPKKMVDKQGNPINYKVSKELKQWFTDNLVGEIVTIESDGRKQEFTNKGLKASLKKHRKKYHNEAYAELSDLIKNSVHDKTIPVDDRHSKTLDGQYVYYGAARIGDKLLSVEIRLDIPKNDNMLHYKDHNIAEIKIEPSLYHTQKTSAIMQEEGSINKISIAVLNGSVKPSTITGVHLFFMGFLS